jgi:alcohol dehydrogenase class IV
MLTTKVIRCTGCFSSELERILRAHHVKRVLVVTGRNLYDLTGAKSYLAPIFEGFAVSIYNYSSPNPKIEDISHCLKMAREHRADVIIGLGGGTAMDVAKATHALLSNPEDPREYILGEKSISQPPAQLLILIPTTAGSGSEATQFAVIYIDKKKYSLASEYLQANYSLLDPSLTLSMPSELTIVTALDALSQAMESYWCVNATTNSKAYAEEALRIIRQNLPTLKGEIALQTREDLLLASHLAGKAINITRTTAAHAISYSFTSNFNVAHGLAVALTLHKFLLFNYDVSKETVQDGRGVDFVKESITAMIENMGFQSAEECSQWLRDTMEDLGVSTRLRDYGVKKVDIETLIVPEFNQERGKNNPKRVMKSDIVQILTELW